MYDFCIIGGGIAGLAVAELLARSGRSVALLEKNSKLCAQATATQHSWFHAGALYSALPNNKFFKTLVGNLDDLFDYYSCFENMNLRAGRNIYTSSATGWFSNHTIFYAYISPKSPEVSLLMKPLWWAATRRAERRLAWFENLDFQRTLSGQVRSVERHVSVDLVKRKGSLGIDIGDVATVLKSRDRTMNTHLITKDIVASFLASGGDLFLSTNVERIEFQRVVAEQGSVQARHIIVASGSECRRLAKVETRVVYSPLAMVSPALSSVNFVRMTPDVSKTLNHLYHRLEGVEYSVVGSALYYDSDTETDRQIALHTLQRRIHGAFPRASDHHWSLYCGAKTELVGASQLRNYQYHITDAGDCTVVLPGKFSLAFSLAVNTCRHFGVEPLKQTMKASEDTEDLDSIIAWPQHYVEARRCLPASSAVAEDGHLEPFLEERKGRRTGTTAV